MPRDASEQELKRAKEAELESWRREQATKAAKERELERWRAERITQSDEPMAERYEKLKDTLVN